MRPSKLTCPSAMRAVRPSSRMLRESNRMLPFTASSECGSEKYRSRPFVDRRLRRG